ncbi:hypothetical protein OPV22_030517 [Ensete ventricosum]|uniref:Uncharacterized protein n=1 Tax=Ensete ventricosum TaxID=4639 RepID=A0AAV8Q997_ENSVE|nr:hypothetical protein OPV22_030517 [Ensete ventricosum]
MTRIGSRSVMLWLSRRFLAAYSCFLRNRTECSDDAVVDTASKPFCSRFCPTKIYSLSDASEELLRNLLGWLLVAGNVLLVLLGEPLLQKTAVLHLHLLVTFHGLVLLRRHSIPKNKGNNMI